MSIVPDLPRRRDLFVAILLAVITGLHSGSASAGLWQSAKEHDKKKVVKFDPVYKAKLSARDGPAKVATSPSDYRRSGYIKIGSIRVEYISKTCFPKGRSGKIKCYQKSYSGTPTERLLQESAKYGGDVVDLRTDNYQASGQATMAGRCIETGTRTVYYTVCRRYSSTGWCAYSTTETRTQTYCKRHKMIYGTKNFTRSQGIVWRHDPELIKRIKYDTIFNQAIRTGNRAHVADLIAKGMPTGRPDMKGRYPIITAVSANRTGITKLLLDNGADPRAESSKALIIATENNNAQIVGMLLDKDADPNSKIGFFKRLRTKTAPAKGQPLIIATSNNNVQIARLLLDKGANPNVKAGQPLKNAIYKRNTVMIKLLLEKGARPGKGSILTTAVSMGDVGLVQMLLDRGASANSKSFGGVTPLQQAARNGNVDIIRLLIKKGAYVNKRSMGQTNTPLIDAVSRGHVQAVRVLLDAKADVNIKNTPKGLGLLSRMARQRGKTALTIARQKYSYTTNPAKKRDYQQIVSMLVAAGAKELR